MRNITIEALRRKIERADKRIEFLEDYIPSEGCRADTCTFGILKEVCNGCRCGKKDKDGEVLSLQTDNE